MDLLTALAVFLAYFVMDVLYALYVLYIGQKDVIRSATYSATIALLNVFGISKVITNPLYLIPLILGAWFGTYIGLKIYRINEDTK